MAWGRTSGTSALQPDNDEDDHKKVIPISDHPKFHHYDGEDNRGDNIIEFPGSGYDGDPDYSDSADYSDTQDYSEPSSLREFDDTDKSAYHHGPQKGEEFKTYFDRNQKAAQNDLKAAEQKAGGFNNSDKSSRDIGSQERLGDNQSTFNYNNSGSGGKGKNKAQGGFFSRHKKGVIGWAVGLILGGGMFTMATILTGPAQLLQIYNFFEDAYNTVHNLTVAYREGRIGASLQGGYNKFMSDRVVRSRVGAIDRKISSSLEAKMSKKGIYLELDSAGRPKIYADPATLTGNSKYSLKDPGESGISAQEKYKRQQAIERANRNLSADAEAAGLTAKPIDADNPTIRNGTIVTEFEAPNQTTALGKSAGKKFLRKLMDLTDTGWISSKIGVRAWAKKAGFVNALFHPVEAAKTKLNNAAYDKVSDFLTRLQASPEQAKANAAASLKRDLETERKPTDTDNADTNAKNRVANDEIDAKIAAADAELAEYKTNGIEPQIGTRRGFLGQLDEAQAIKVEGRLNKIGQTAGILSFVIAIICALYNLADSGTLDAFINTVIPAIKLSGVMVNMASQMMAGDLSMEDIGAFIEAFVYNDEYPVSTTETSGEMIEHTKEKEDAEGNLVTVDQGKDFEVSGDNTRTTETITSSMWDACVIKSEMDPTYDCSETSTSAINPALTDVAKGTVATDIMDNITEGLNSVVPGLGTAIIDYGLGGLCSDVGMAIVSILSVALSGVVAFFTGDWVGFGLALSGAILNYAPTGMSASAREGVDLALDLAGAGSLQGSLMTLIQHSIGPAINMLGENLEGEELDWTYSSPEEKGNASGFGYYYNAQLTGLTADSGVTLTPNQQSAWNREKNVYLAEQYDQKSLWAKLFDPTDYRSMVATLGREAGINPNPDSIGDKLKNTAKMFGALPKLAFSTFFNSPVKAVAAASGATSYDYNLAQVAVPLDVLEDFSNMGENSDPTKDIYANADKVFDLVTGPEKDKYNELTRVCFGKKINPDDLSVEIDDSINNGIGTTFYDMEKGDYKNKNCAGLMDKTSGNYDENLARISVYTGLDWNIINSYGCIYGEEKACDYLGYGKNASSDNVNNSPNSDTVASGEVKELAQKILDLSSGPDARFSYAAGLGDIAEMESLATTGKTLTSKGCGGTVSLDSRLLGLLLAASDKYKIEIGAIWYNYTYCAGTGHPAGWAVDLNGVTEIDTGASTKFHYVDDADMKVINGFVQTLDKISENSGIKLSIGQVDECGIDQSKLNVTTDGYPDACNHLHVDMRRMNGY